LAKITVSGDKAVQYDGSVFYPSTTAYSVKDTYENYQRSLLDVADSLITVSEDFTAVNPEGVLVNQADSTAADVAGVVADFNALLAKLKTAGLMTKDA
jgi:hypothetical protein